MVNITVSISIITGNVSQSAVIQSGDGNTVNVRCNGISEATINDLIKILNFRDGTAACDAI